jgi:hypothetical protein
MHSLVADNHVWMKLLYPWQFVSQMLPIFWIQVMDILKKKKDYNYKVYNLNCLKISSEI